MPREKSKRQRARRPYDPPLMYADPGLPGGDVSARSVDVSARSVDVSARSVDVSPRSVDDSPRSVDDYPPRTQSDLGMGADHESGHSDLSNDSSTGSVDSARSNDSDTKSVESVQLASPAAILKPQRPVWDRVKDAGRAIARLVIAVVAIPVVIALSVPVAIASLRDSSQPSMLSRMWGSLATLFRGKEKPLEGRKAVQVTTSASPLQLRVGSSSNILRRMDSGIGSSPASSQPASPAPVARSRASTVSDGQVAAPVSTAIKASEPAHTVTGVRGYGMR